jgi:hypothetical protein
VKPFAVENRVWHDVLQHVSHEDEGDQSARVFGDSVLQQVSQVFTMQTHEGTSASLGQSSAMLSVIHPISKIAKK